MALSEETRSRISDTLNQHKIVLFMKGTKQMPRCGFSAQVVQILNGHGVEYHTVDVLSDPAIRDGIKEFGNWPTIPQLYFEGSLVGGCDIIRELDASGELLPNLGMDAPPPVAPPALKIDAAAVAAIKEASGEADPGQHLRMELKNGGRNIDLYFDSEKPGDVRFVQGDLVILFDRTSAKQANGISIEYVSGPDGGFKIDNPNLPPKPRSMSVRELKAKLDQKAPLHLYDVRPPAERAIASIAGALPLDEAARVAIEKMPKDTVLVFHCHHGMRSQQAADYFAHHGFKNVYNLTGGIEAWSTQVDPSVPRY